jgi:lipid II:glycine glycyltransferase (peptidoglycan interpeptide bridge formation enzyme)
LVFENGFLNFDFVGIDLEDAKGLLSGRHRSDPFKCQITFFKVGFGGEILVLPGEYCYFPNLALNLVFRTVGRTLLESKLVHRLTGALHSISRV